MVSLTGRLVLPDPLWNGGPAPRWRCPGALTPDHPRTAGPREWACNQRLVKGETSGSPQRPRSHSAPPSPYEDIIMGAPLGASVPEDWCQSVDPPKMSIFTPRAMQVAPSQDPATLCSTISSPQQLDQGPIIRKLSRDDEQTLHLILANRPRSILYYACF